MVEYLRRYGYDPDWTRVETASEFEAALTAEPWDAVLSDYNMSGFTGLDALEIYQRTGLDIPFILVSGSIGEERAVDAMRRGAHDYIIKDRVQRLAPAVERELRECVTRRERREANLELRRLNRELQESMMLLTRSTADLKQFTFAASHDLQEPLRTVSNYAQLLVRRHAGSAVTEEAEFAGFITDAVERMRDLIQGIIAYSDAGRNPQRQGVADAQDVAEDARMMLADRIEACGATVEIGPLPRVRMERKPLLQVFRSLLGNALKYRRADVPPQIAISAEQENGLACFAVADNGIGIEEAYRERIFELFRRLHGTDYPGIGLGLALAKRLVETHQGRIWVESTPGEGSTFYFILPMAGDRMAVKKEYASRAASVVTE